MAALLSVNLNKVALLRNSRPHGVPDLVKAAEAVLDAGAHGLTAHPRPDQRHIRPDDVRALTAVATRRGVELNLEGNPFEDRNDTGFPGFLNLVDEVRPAQATLVPDSADQATSDHGFTLSDRPVLAPALQRLKGWGCRVSLFVDAGTDVAGFRDIGADRVELYTGPYAQACWSGQPEAALEACRSTAAAAAAAGLGVNAGHDLDLTNLGALARAIPDLAEVSIGHALTADALWLGWSETIRRYLTCLS